jgi:hypothetical protein
MMAQGLESYADLYKGAVINLHEKTPGHIRFVCHAVRDLMNGMAAFKLGHTRSQTDYVILVSKFLDDWEKHGLPKGLNTLDSVEIDDNSDMRLHIPRPIFDKIQDLFTGHEEARRRSEESPFLFFEVFLPNATAREALPQSYPKMWKDLRRWFVEHAHESGKIPDQEVFNQIENQFDQLELILLSVADRYSNTIATIDEILDEANS